jgi:septum formation protein
MELKFPVILASQSPRRADILKKSGFNFKIIPTNITEHPYSDGSINDYVQNLAIEKAQIVASNYPNHLIIGADTIVMINGQILGKPCDEDEGQKMLQTLSGKWHKVKTAFSLVHVDSNFKQSYIEETLVHFREISVDEIQSYIKSGSYKDKAGAYGIQDTSASFVDSIEGCFYNVVGFPISRFIKILKLSPFYN